MSTQQLAQIHSVGTWLPLFDCTAPKSSLRKWGTVWHIWAIRRLNDIGWEVRRRQLFHWLLTNNIVMPAILGFGAGNFVLGSVAVFFFSYFRSCQALKRFNSNNEVRKLHYFSWWERKWVSRSYNRQTTFYKRSSHRSVSPLLLLLVLELLSLLQSLLKVILRSSYAYFDEI